MRPCEPMILPTSLGATCTCSTNLFPPLHTGITDTASRSVTIALISVVNNAEVSAAEDVIVPSFLEVEAESHLQSRSPKLLGGRRPSNGVNRYFPMV